MHVATSSLFLSARAARRYSSAVLAVARSLAVCPLRVSVGCSAETAGRIELIFGTIASFELKLILHCGIRKSGYLRNKSASFWNFVSNSGLNNFATEGRSS